MVDTLRSCVASPVVAVRVAAAGLLAQAASDLTEDDDELVGRRLLPALVSLAADTETAVRCSAVSGLVGLLAWSGEGGPEVREKASVQLDCLLEDPAGRVVVEVVRAAGRLVTGCPATRDAVVLPKMAAAARACGRITTGRQELVAVLLTVRDK